MSALAVLRAQKAILQAGKLAFRAAGIVFYIRGSAATEEALLLRSHAISLRFSFLCAVRHSCFRCCSLFRATTLIYHIFFSLSTTFFNFFWMKYPTEKEGFEPSRRY